MTRTHLHAWTLATGLLIAGLLLAGISLALPAAAETWPGTTPSPGGAISAKVIAEHCPGTLTATEAEELDHYLDRAAAEWDDKNFSFPEFRANLSKSYASSFTNGRPCDEDTTSGARDMSQRVHRHLASGAPIYAPK